MLAGSLISKFDRENILAVSSSNFQFLKSFLDILFVVLCKYNRMYTFYMCSSFSEIIPLYL